MAAFGAFPLRLVSRLFVTLSLVGLAGFASLHLSGRAVAESASAALAAKPVSLPDMALGGPKAAVTIVEYASMTCPHCAAFEQNVFPMLKRKYIDTGKVRFVFREFPLDIKAAAASMLARCIAGNDAGKYFDAINQLFKEQDQLAKHTKDTLKRIGEQQASMSEEAVETC